ncbi:MAG: hypothetical protein KC516_04090 [Nanoarchaeota archaeon]|nr:hypothetical protein [Nanoarchaeota archaeon]
MRLRRKSKVNISLITKLREEIKPYFKEGWKIQRICPHKKFYLIDPIGEKINKEIILAYKNAENEVHTQYEYSNMNRLEKAYNLLDLFGKYLFALGKENKIKFV